MSETETFQPYAIGICTASVCSTLPVEEVLKRMNREEPTGLDHGWMLAEEAFADGTENPHPCERGNGMHFLLAC